MWFTTKMNRAWDSFCKGVQNEKVQISFQVQIAAEPEACSRAVLSAGDADLFMLRLPVKTTR
jgi:hypothetical protein